MDDGNDKEKNKTSWNKCEEKSIDARPKASAWRQQRSAQATDGGPDNDGSKEKRNFWNKCEEEHLTARPKIGSSKRKDKVQSQNEEATGSAQKQKDEKKRSTAEKPSEDARPT
ncbi:uncharacterized protein ACN427_005427 isoform 1-T2 [Glossina fuscipes fuscipes]